MDSVSDKNIHENHRQRLRERFEKAPDSLSGHELLEILLFYAIPRANVNPLAHKLINKFGSLSGVLRASTDELKAVDGVGNSTAVYLSAVGKIYDRVLDENFLNRKLYTFDAAKKYLVRYYSKQPAETFMLIMLDENDRIISKEGFSQGSKNQALVPFAEFSSRMAGKKVTSVIVAHNHPSGILTPSKDDDLATEQMLLYCSMIGVKLYDHIIITDNNAFSYRLDDRLDNISNRFVGRDYNGCR